MHLLHTCFKMSRVSGIDCSDSKYKPSKSFQTHLLLKGWPNKQNLVSLVILDKYFSHLSHNVKGIKTYFCSSEAKVIMNLTLHIQRSKGK